MYKKIYLYILIAILSITCLVYYGTNSKNISVGSQDDFYQTLGDLENTSDLIVRVKPTFLTKVHIEIYSNGTPTYGWTNKVVLIDELYKAPETFSKKSIKVREPYWKHFSFIEGRVLTSLGGYIPMKLGKTYILFLRKNEDGTYWINYTDQGKYLINDRLVNSENLDKLKPADFELGYEVPKYREFYKDIIKKYYYFFK